MKSLFLSSLLITHVRQDDFHQEFRPLPRSMSDKIEGVWSPEYDEESLYPLMFRSPESLTRSRLGSCDWELYPHYCRLRHFASCLRPGDLNVTTIGYLRAGGRLGNAMSTYAAMIAVRERFGIRGLVDLTTFQVLDHVFLAVREVGVLEEEVCDADKFEWAEWDGHVTEFEEVRDLYKGKAVYTYPMGIASEEYVHGGAQLFTPSLQRIRKSFRFRQRFVRRATVRLSEIVAEYVRKVNKRKKSVKITADDCDLVGVHIRRTDHLEFEKLNGATPLSKRYFTQAMQTYSDSVRHPVFVVVTDDPEWARDNIPASFRPQLTGFYDVKDRDSAGLDLAVLSLCNHLVLSRGTFGLWASVLSGKTRILPKHFHPQMKGKPFDMRNQVPIFDLSHHWMSEEIRASLRELCPECLTNHPTNNTVRGGTLLVE